MGTRIDHGRSLHVAVDVRADIGESPTWDETTGTLRFVDSSAGRVHRFDPTSGALTTFEIGQPVGAVIRRSRGGVVVTARDGLIALDERSGRTDLLVPVEHDVPDNRMNDARCDSRGRLWVGTFSMSFARKRGAVYRIDPDLRTTRAVTGIYISNGIAWSPDERRMYYVDTATRGVDVFDYDVASGALANRRRFVDIDREEGLPDGITVDADGCLWVALYYGGAVRRYGPDGAWIGTVTLPVARVTSCGFGGPGLEDLYVTTATHRIDDDGRPHEPLAGAVFRCSPGARGRPDPPFEG